MKVDYLPRAQKALQDAPEPVRRAFFKQVNLLANNLSHPSLHAKKYDESRDLWQARVKQRLALLFSYCGRHLFDP
jgi:mRNA-degrading endonuclease RelE of RelBE toxin-antitoxin system